MLKEFVRVASVEEVPDNSMIGVSVDGEDLLVAQVGGEYFAIDDWCTHAAGMLHEGELHTDVCEVECPIHEGTFDLASGDPINPPPEEPVVAYDVRVEDGSIFVGPKQ